MISGVPVIDGHNDLPWRLRTRDPHGTLDIAGDLRGAGLHTDLPRLREGGVGAQFWSVYVPVDRPEPKAAVQVLEQIDLVRRLVAQHPDQLAIATSADEVVRIQAGGRVAS